MSEFDSVDSPPSAATVAALAANHRDFLRFLERRVGDRAEAEDILQKAFVKGVEAAASLREGQSAVAWFYRLLRNAVIDHYRRRATSSRKLTAFAEELDGSPDAPGADMNDAVCACVRTLADTLKPEYTEALTRVELDGVSVQGYAAELGITANNAAVRVHRAREALRKRVLASCGTCAEHGCLNCTCDAGSQHS
jgi:RNA polymerase sigma-70 factor (ECF subfamily)